MSSTAVLEEAGLPWGRAYNAAQACQLPCLVRQAGVLLSMGPIRQSLTFLQPDIETLKL